VDLPVTPFGCGWFNPSGDCPGGFGAVRLAPFSHEVGRHEGAGAEVEPIQRDAEMAVE
jgi:hypothetical protein